MARIYKEELLEKNNYYDVIVVGGGHAGIEASLAPARLGLKTLMICGNIKKIGKEILPLIIVQQQIIALTLHP